MPDYQQLTDDEVLQIATERETLTDDARAVLDSELSRRRLSLSDIETHKEAYDRADQLEESRRRRLIRSFSVNRSGIGTTFLGKRNLTRDHSGKFEEYETTRWFIVFGIPVYPIATFRVRRRLARWIGLTFGLEPHVLKRHARDWEQILLTWVKTAAVLLVLRLIYLLVKFHPEVIERVVR